VRELGGETTDVHESPSGWSADCKDPSGTSFSIGRMRPEFDVGEGGATSGPGTLRYFTIPVTDLAVARQFFRGVFGWQYDVKNSHDAYAHVAGTEPACGLVVSKEKAPSIWFMTPDIGASVAKVRELGGTAEDASSSDSGHSSACVSDGGTRFNLWQPV
jgi:predicted enzyme related to lactoylglutathione lyase